MSGDKRWFCTALGIMTLAFAIVGLANYVLDPYGLFRKDFSWQFVEPNSNFLKVRHVTENPDRYDCFVFGSSRVSNIDVRTIKHYRCYNMTCNGGLPHEYLDNLRYMLKKGVKMNLVLMGLDDFSFKSNPAERLGQPLRHPYPPVLNEHLLPFYVRYLFSIHAQHIMSPVIEGYMAKIRGTIKMPSVYYDIPDTGQILVPGVDRFIEEHPEAHRKDPKFTEKIESVTGDNMKGTVDDLTQMVNLLKVHGIRSVFFINPPYKNWFLDLNLDEFGRFERELARLTDFYDFSGINSITGDAYNFYNPSHYRLPIGNLMLARMLDDNTNSHSCGRPSLRPGTPGGSEESHPQAGTRAYLGLRRGERQSDNEGIHVNANWYKATPVPADFGVLVTSGNVEAHLQHLKEQVAGETKSADAHRK